LDDNVVSLTSGTPKLAIGSGSYVNRFTMFDESESIEVGMQLSTRFKPFRVATTRRNGTTVQHGTLD
jgi:hypothetical protein